MEFGELPAELLNPPIQLVILMNLDIKNNQEHKSIWDCFVMNRRPDRLPLNFVIANSTHEFPKPRRKKTVLENLPNTNLSCKYIFKSNWFYKHASLIPAVVVLFMDLDWDNPSWNEKKYECASKVEALRHSLQGRNTRICVVLVQNSPPLPPDSAFSQRATELCSQCDLSPKSLFVLPRTDHLFGYILRLEHAFYELATNYYQSEIKTVKQIKDSVSKASNLSMLIRYQIKLAFLNDLRQDPHSALRHYKQAYQHLTEIKLDDYNVFETKIIAGMLNYKMSKICFQNGTPLDAIAHFRKHIDYFKDQQGFENLQFEHLAWMSKQFGLFADLFDSAVQNGLAAIQTQNPGFYYQSASEYAIKRRQLAEKLKLNMNTQLLSADQQQLLQQLAANLHNFTPEFYGQRPWSADLNPNLNTNLNMPNLNLTSTNPNTPLCSQDSAIFYYKWREFTLIDHSALVLHYLSSAMVYFKRYKCPRMRLLIMVRTGEQYMLSGDFEKALQILSPAVWEYRNEKWFLLLKTASILALKCAWAVANLKAYVSIILELCSPILNLPLEDRKRLQKNLDQILQNRLPDPEPDFLAIDPSNLHVLDKAKNAWATLLNDRCFFHIPMHNIFSFIDVRLYFECPLIKADELAILNVCIRLNCPLPMNFCKLCVQFNNNAYDNNCIITNTLQQSSLNFTPNETKRLRFEFLPLPDNVGKEIVVTSLTLDVGNPQCNVYGSLQWENFDRCGMSTIHSEFFPCNQAKNRLNPESIDNLQNFTVLKLLPRSSKIKMEFSHNAPILCGELYKITVRLTNLENCQVQNAKFSARSTNENAEIEFLHQNSFLSNFDSDLGPLAPETKLEICIFLRCKQTISPLTVEFQVSYDVQIDTKFGFLTCFCNGKEILAINVVSPFSLTSNLLTYKGEPVEKLVFDEKCLLTCDLKCISQFPIKILSIDWKLSSELVNETAESDLEIYRQMELYQDDISTLICCLKPTDPKNQSILMGHLVIKWVRLENDQNLEDNSKFDPQTLTLPKSAEVETHLELLTCPIENSPVLVNLHIPAYGCVRHAFSANYELKNLTDSILELQIQIESSESFMFSGNKQVSLHILPYSEVNLPFVFLPLIAGQSPLPRLKLTSGSYAQEILDKLAQRNVPTSMFILPFAKEKQHHNVQIRDENVINRPTPEIQI